MKLISRIFAALVVLAFLTGTAVAQTCTSYPYTLTNGTTADASQVMANLNYVLNCTNNNQVVPSILRGWLGGLAISNDSATPNTVIDTSAGIANSDDATTLMTLAAFTKNANGAWAVGTGNGCLDSGSSLAASTWYHLFVITRTDTGVVDELCSTSATGPTLPTSYTKKRRIGSFRTNSSSQILAFTQDGDYFRWAASVLDVNNTNPGTAAVTRTLTVPTGVNVFAIFNAGSSNSAAAGYGVYFSELSANDETPTQSNAPLMNVIGSGAGIGGFIVLQIRTNTSAQVRSRNNASDANTTLRVATLGWIDSRGRFQ